MKTNECNGGSQPSGWKDGIGKLWFPTNNGLVVIDPDKLPINRFLPPVQIEKITFDGENVAATSSTRNAVQFRPGQGKLEFQYTALSFLVPERVRFQYKLEGFSCDIPDSIEERNRISREIHDTLTQDFTGVVLQLEAAEMTMQNPSEDTKDLINRARELARAQQAAARTDLNVSLEVSGIRRQLPAQIEDNLIRIVREACTNVVKHASAKNLKLRLKYRMLKVDLDIHDDGRGFRIEEVSPNQEGGFGLTSMKERARKLRAKFRILSKADGGTHIHVSVPAFLHALRLQNHGDQKR